VPRKSQDVSMPIWLIIQPDTVDKPALTLFFGSVLIVWLNIVSIDLVIRPFSFAQLCIPFSQY
jgi:hypothetical protein